MQVGVAMVLGALAGQPLEGQVLGRVHHHLTVKVAGTHAAREAQLWYSVKWLPARRQAMRLQYTPNPVRLHSENHSDINRESGPAPLLDGIDFDSSFGACNWLYT